MPHTRRSVSALILALVSALALGVLPSAQAGVDAGIKLSPGVGPPTSVTTMRGRGFGASERVRIDLDGLFLAAARTDPAGDFFRRLRIPAEAAPGPHLMSATGRDSGEHATAEFLVRTNWRRFHFDSANTGLNPFENVLNTGNVSTLEVKWSAATSPGAAPTPVVWGGMVFVASADGVVRALGASTGSIIWTQDVGETDASPPDVANGLVYVMNVAAEVFALHADSGEIAWTRDLGEDDATPPNVSNGIMYATAIVDLPQGSTTVTLALDAATGALRWKGPTTGAPDALAVARGLVHTAGAIGGYVSAYDASTGAEVWSVFDCGEYCPVSSVAAAGRLVFLAYLGSPRGMNALTGQTAWIASEGAVSYSGGPAIAGNAVYLGNGLDEEVVAWNAFNGDVLWRAPLPGGTTGSSPAVANGVLYIGSDDGRLRAYDAATGEPLWESPDLGTPFQASPAVSDGMVYGAVEDGTVYAFGLP